MKLRHLLIATRNLPGKTDLPGGSQCILIVQIFWTTGSRKLASFATRSPSSIYLDCSDDLNDLDSQDHQVTAWQCEESHIYTKYWLIPLALPSIPGVDMWLKHSHPLLGMTCIESLIPLFNKRMQADAQNSSLLRIQLSLGVAQKGPRERTKKRLLSSDSKS